MHSDDGKHLGIDRLFIELKKQFTGFSRKILLTFVGMCPECEKSKKSLKSIVTKPIRSSEFASRGQVDLIDLIDMQATREMNEPYYFLLVYQDHLTKFIVLRPLKRKTADEVLYLLSLISSV